MSDVHRTYEVRCPIHGFIAYDDWERTVIATPEFQRLRRIRQLAFTDFVYPGATHSRFEHSLGVMHLATRVYDALRTRFDHLFREKLGYDDGGFARDRRLVRFAALLHDVGHGPLSHASESLMPKRTDGKEYTHEEYSAAIIRTRLKDAIESHALNENCELRAENIADLLDGRAETRRAVFWRELISGQLDADRMDYLLRDSYHAGVQYGRFDLERIVATAALVEDPETQRLRIGLKYDGFHAAESVILARYFMFTQVYFHKTRLALDIALRNLLRELLPEERFPSPEDLEEYLKWDDWRVFGEVAAGRGGEWGRMIYTRNQLRAVAETLEVANKEAVERIAGDKAKLGGLFVAEERAEKSWYRTGEADVLISTREGVRPLFALSSVVANMRSVNQIRLFVRQADFERANLLMQGA